MKRFIHSITLAVVALALPACAQEAAKAPTLKIGDAAPKLQVGKWAQGEAVKGFESDKTYIVEFWATWCGPCVATIPHLNELHTKFKDKNLVVIGQNVWEDDESKVAPFIKKMGEKMTYRVALDDKSKEEKGAMAKTWMEAAGQTGIPAAFVVNKAGKIAWIGHPATLKEKLLEDILAGRFDVEKAAREAAESQKNQAQIRTLSRKLGKSMDEKNWADAEAAVADLEKILSEEQRVGLGLVRFQILAGKKDFTGAYKLAGEISDKNPDVAPLQYQIALTIAAQPGLENRDLKVAEKAAERANKATEGKEPEILATLARVQFMSGKKPEAIATQQKAVTLADADSKEELEKTLTSYKADKLPAVED